MAGGEALVSAEVIAAALSVSRCTVYRMEKRGEIPSIRVGGVLRFERAAVIGALRRERKLRI